MNAGDLHSHVETVNDGLRDLCAQLVHALADAGSLREGLDLRLEIERLHALIDGLALHAAVQPGRTTPARARRLLRLHIDSLVTQNPLQTKDFAPTARQVRPNPE